MEEVLYYSNLFNIYKDLLTEKNKEIFSLYYDENLSLQEIADNLGVSKSFVGTSIKKCETKLEEYENKLHIYNKNKELNNLLECSDINKIKKIISSILNN